MSRLPVLTWIGNAAAVLCGPFGAITRQAQLAGCSRQAAYDHARRVEQAVADARLAGPTRAQLLLENERLRQENQQLWDWLQEALDVAEARQRRFAATAAALGLSLGQTLLLLAVVLPRRACPSRATLGRWVHDASARAGRVLRVLDGACLPLVLALCLDEIFFHRRPVLMGVEPYSLAWVLGARAADRSGPTWSKALAAWGCVEDVAADGGSGIELGLTLAHAKRQEEAAKAGQAARPLRKRPDVFHLRRDGAQGLRAEWHHAEGYWEEAEARDRAKARLDRQGQDKRKCNGHPSGPAWAQATQAFEEAQRKEQAWARAVAALEVFRPDGRLNDRAWAEAELAAAAAALTGPRWAKVRRVLADPRLLTFLDRLHEDLAAAEPRAECRQALAALWRWRQSARRRRSKTARAREALRQQLREQLVSLVGSLLGDGWEAAYARVAGVLRRVVRASSAVEGVNSVVRMHQARHRTLTQGLLDLKRLYWNCRRFREGKRRDHCPYGLLGLKLPTDDPWELLQLDPEKLQQQLSSPKLAA